MKASYSKELFLTGVILLISCSSGSDNFNEEIDGIPEYHLTVVDSFGDEIGDSLTMIGSINDFCHSTDGSVLLLDCTALHVREISKNNEVNLLCREGEAPGEFLYPLALCALENGHFLVSDELNQEVMEYNSSGLYLQSFISTGGYVPYSIYPVDSVTIVCDLNFFEMGFDIPRYRHIVGGFHSGETDPFILFSDMSWEWTSAEFYRDIELLDFTADSTGRVFIVSDNTEYKISVVSIDGTDLATIIGEVERIKKTSEVIQQEIAEFEEWAKQDRAYMGGYQPSDYYQLISLPGVDTNGNLWVQRHDSDDVISFDVWDTSCNLLYTVSFDQNEGIPELDFHVDNHGILGANTESEEYPRIYTFELDRGMN